MNITNEMIEAARSAYNANTPTIIPRGGKLAHETKLMHTILSAALSVEAQPVAVKPLEWRIFCSRSGNSQADSPLGEYVIQYEEEGADRLWMLYLPHQDTRHGKGHDTAEKAKAAAQADFEARIRSALSTPPAPASSEPVAGTPVTLTYTNWRGETARRTVKPKYIWFGSTEWHPEPQWLLTAFDLEKDAERDFALSGFGSLAPTPAGEGWRPIETAPKDGTEFIARCGAEFPSFSCSWDGMAFIHYDFDDGVIRYPVTEWMPFPGPAAAATQEGK